MPSTTLTMDWGLLAAVGQESASVYRDGLAKEVPLLNFQEQAHGKGKPKWEGGANFNVTVNMQNHTGITAFTDGYELFDPTAYETQRDPLYPLCMSGLLMKIGGLEMYYYGATDGGLRKKIDYLTKSCMGFLRRQWETRILGGTGSGFTQWLTLNGIDSTSGVFERAAVGSQSNTVGGLSKSTRRISSRPFATSRVCSRRRGGSGCSSTSRRVSPGRATHGAV